MKVASRSFWSILDNLVQQVLSFAIFLILARWLTPHEFGLLAIAHLVVQFHRMSLLDALAMPVVRAPQADDRLFDWLFTICTVASLLVAAVMVLLAWPMARFFDAPDLTWVLVGMSLSVVLFGLGRAHDGRLLREGNFKVMAIRSLCSVTAGGAVALWLATRGAGAMALVAQQVVMGVVALVVAVAAEWRHWRPRWNWSRELLREHRGETRRIGLNACVNYANNNGDAALVSVLLGPHATGLYNLAKRVLSAAYLVIASSLSRVGVSLFVQRQGDPAALAHAYRRMLGWTLLLLAPMYALVSLAAEPLVVIAFGERWRESASLFGWLSVAYVAQAAFWLGQNLSFATRQSARVLKLSTVQLAVTAVLAAALSPWGMQGIAAGVALGSVAGCVLMQLAVHRQLSISSLSFVRSTLPATLGTASVAALLWSLPHAGIDPQRMQNLLTSPITHSKDLLSTWQKQ